jgi:hypothetical protein
MPRIQVIEENAKGKVNAVYDELRSVFGNVPGVISKSVARYIRAVHKGNRVNHIILKAINTRSQRDDRGIGF